MEEKKYIINLKNIEQELKKKEISEELILLLYSLNCLNDENKFNLLEQGNLWVSINYFDLLKDLVLFSKHLLLEKKTKSEIDLNLFIKLFINYFFKNGINNNVNFTIAKNENIQKIANKCVYFKGGLNYFTKNFNINDPKIIKKLKEYLYLIYVIVYQNLYQYFSSNLLIPIISSKLYWTKKNLIPFFLPELGFNNFDVLKNNIKKENDLFFEDIAKLNYFNEEYLKKIINYFKSNNLSSDHILFALNPKNNVNYKIYDKITKPKLVEFCYLKNVLWSYCYLLFLKYQTQIFLKPNYFSFLSETDWSKKKSKRKTFVDNQISFSFYYLDVLLAIKNFIEKNVDSKTVYSLNEKTKNEISIFFSKLKNLFDGNLKNFLNEFSIWVNPAKKVYKIMLKNFILTDFDFFISEYLYESYLKIEDKNDMATTANYLFIASLNLFFKKNQVALEYVEYNTTNYFKKIFYIIDILNANIDAFNVIIKENNINFRIEKFSNDFVSYKLILNQLKDYDNLLFFDFFPITNELSANFISKILQKNKIYIKNFYLTKVSSWNNFVKSKKFLVLLFFSYFLNLFSFFFKKEEIITFKKDLNFNFDLIDLELTEYVTNDKLLQNNFSSNNHKKIFVKALEIFIKQIFNILIKSKSILNQVYKNKLLENERLDIKKYFVSENIYWDYFEANKFDVKETYEISDIYTLFHFAKNLIDFNTKFLNYRSILLRELPQIINFGFTNKNNGLPLDCPLPNIEETNDKTILKKKILEFNLEQENLKKEYIELIPTPLDYGFRAKDGCKVTLPKNFLKENFLTQDLNFFELQKIKRHIEEFNDEQQKFLFDYLKKIPHIARFNFTKTFHDFDVKYKKPEKKVFTSKNDIVNYIESVNCYNKEQNAIYEEYLKNIPEVIDYGIRHNLDGSLWTYNKPYVDLLNLKNEKDFKNLISSIEKWNEVQEVTWKNIQKNIPSIKNLGFTEYPDGEPIVHNIPIIDLKKISNLKYQHQIILEITNFNKEQKEILKLFLDTLPKINDLGFKYDSEGQKILDIPKFNRLSIKNKKDFDELYLNIKKFNEIQSYELLSQSEFLPEVKDLGFKTNIDGSNLKFKNYNLANIEVKNKKDIEKKAELILAFNEEQEKILKEAIDNLPAIEDKKIKFFPDYRPVKYEKPIISEWELRNKDDVDKLNIYINNFNQEQKAAFEEYLNLNIEILDYGFRKEDSKNLAILPKISEGDLKHIDKLLKKVENIKDWNNEQESLRNNLLKEIPLIKDLGFRKNYKNESLNFTLPEINSINLSSKAMIQQLIFDINNFNQEQKLTLLNCKKHFIKVKDYGIRLVPGTNKKVDNSYPRIDLNLITDYYTYKQAYDKVKKFNEEQFYIIKRLYDSIPKIIDFGYVSGKDTNVKKPTHLKLDQIESYEQLTIYEKNIKNWNKTQQQLLDKDLKNLPAIVDRGFISDINNNPIKISKDKLKEVNLLFDLDKTKIKNSELLIKAFNEEQNKILTQFKQKLSNLLKTYYFYQKLDGSPLDYNYSKIDLNNVNTLEEVNEAFKKINSHNVEQKELFLKYIKKIPQVKNFGFSVEDKINLSYPIVNIEKLKSKSDIDSLIIQINDWNEAQVKKLEEYKKKLGEPIDLGFTKRNDGSRLNFQKPKISFSNINQRDHLIELQEAILNYNTEQKNLLIELKRTCPKIINSNIYNERIKNLTNPNLIDINSLKRKEDVETYIKAVKEWNKNQNISLEKK